MTQHTPPVALAVLGALVLAISAHAGDAHATSAHATSAHATSAHAGDARKTSRPYQKPGIPLTLLHGEAPKTAVGETATVAITLLSPANATVQLTLSSKTGLDLLGPSTRTVGLAADTPQTLTLDVRAGRSGRHYLDVVAGIDGVAGTRAVSAPVQVGAGGVVGKSTPGTLASEPDGTRVIAMPAVETVNGVVVIRDPASEPR